MTHRALIRLGGRATQDVLRSPPTRSHTELYGRPEEMQILDGDLAPYVCVDHSKEPIGRVKSVFSMDSAESVNGGIGGKWLAAVVEIDDPPSWLKVGTPASISYAPTWRREENGWTVVERALLREVSILSGDKRPAEPCAQVLTLTAVEPPQPIRRTLTRVQRDAAERDELRRRQQWLDQHGYSYRFEDLLEGLMIDTGHQSNLSRVHARYPRRAA